MQSRVSVALWMRSAALALFAYTRCIECLGNQWNPPRSDTVAGGNSKSDGWPDQSAMSSYAHTRMQSCTFITLYSRHKEWKRNTLKLWLLRRIQVDSCQKDFFLFLFLFVFTSDSLSRCPEEFLHWHSELVIAVVPFKATYQTAGEVKRKMP